MESGEDQGQRQSAVSGREGQILAAVSEAAEKFLRSVSLRDEYMAEMIAELGRAAQVSRVYVFENHLGEDGSHLTSQRYEWVANGIEPQLGNPELKDFPWQAGGMGRWEKMLGCGELVLGHAREFPGSEQKVLDPQGILSVVAVPVNVGERWWGFIGFDECTREREWTQAEIRALKMASAILGAAIQRRQTEQELARHQTNLEELVRERTAELARANEQLREEMAAREKTREALKESEEKYRTLVEGSVPGIVVLQGNRIVFTNQAFADISGYTVEELEQLGPEQVMATGRWPLLGGNGRQPPLATARSCSWTMIPW
jgi:GAF domain-containing protein